MAKQPEGKLDIGATLEATLYQLSRLVAQVVRTAVTHLFRPSRMNEHISQLQRTEVVALEDRRYAQPLVYLFVACIVFVAALTPYASLLGEHEFEEVARKPFGKLGLFAVGLLQDLDFSKLMALLFPVIFVAYFFARLSSAIARSLRGRCHFPLHLGITSYSLGSALLLLSSFLVAVPAWVTLLQGTEDQSPMVLLLVAVWVLYVPLFMALSLWCFLRYLALLHRCVLLSWSRTFGMFVATSTVSLFVVLSLAVAINAALQVTPGESKTVTFSFGDAPATQQDGMRRPASFGGVS